MIDNKIHVAQIIGRVNEGGIEGVISSLCANIDHSKVVIDFYACGSCNQLNKEKVERYGGRFFQIPPYKKLGKFKKALREAFKSNHYDIVHSNMNSLNFLALNEAKKAGIKIRIAHSHSTSNKKEFLHHIIKSFLKPFAKKGATHFFACSKLAGDWLFGKKTKYYLINNGADFSRFAFNVVKREEIRKELGIDSSSKVLGHIGRLEPQKNHFFLLKIYEEVLKTNPNTYLILIGKGKLKDKILSYISSHNLDKVKFLDAISRPEDYYQAMDAFILPSLYEGLPVVGSEAQVNQLKCFFSDEITKEAKLIDSTEFISIKKGEKPWADSINKFLASNIIREKEKVDDSYDIKNVSKYLLSLYQEFLKQ